MQKIFRHFRYPKAGGLPALYCKPYKRVDGSLVLAPFRPEERGGFTVCVVKEDDHVVSCGFAECSLKDAFNYDTGRQLAETRAMKAMDGEEDTYKMPERSPFRAVIPQINAVIRACGPAL